MGNFNDLIVDVGNNRLVSSFLSTRSEGSPPVILGDTQPVSIRLVEQNNNNADQPWKNLDLTGQTIRVGVGSPGAEPIGGTFTLTINSETTDAIPYGASAEDLKTALDALTMPTDPTISTGEFEVEEIGGGYTITYPYEGNDAAMVVNTSLLTPSSTSNVIILNDGVTSVSAEVQSVTFEQEAAAYIELTADLDAPAATITEVRTGVIDTTSEIQRVTISGDPYAGTYTLTVASDESSNLEVDSSSDSIKTALESLTSIGADNVTVTGSGLDYTVEFDKSLGDVGAITADLTNLTSPTGKKGEIDFNTDDLLYFLDGQKSKDATLEVVRYTTTGAKSDTVLQANITCKQDII
jgi:hypothetical protein